MKDTKTFTLSAALRAKIDAWIVRYPADQKASGILQALHYAQEENGNSLNAEILNAVADYLGMSRTVVYEVATFYSLFHLKPMGKHLISVCNNISCMLRGADDILDYVKKRLGIEVGETTADGQFSLQVVECLGACVGAPMLQLGKEYYENLTPEKIDQILEKHTQNIN